MVSFFIRIPWYNVYPYVGLSFTPCFDIDYGPRLDESELPVRVRKYCRDTRMRYIDQSVLPESDWPPTLGGQYIRLALVKQGRTTRDFEYRKIVVLQEYYVRGKYDKILQDKTKIKLEKIFDPIFCQGGYEVPRLKMLIDGAPGVGKTTLSRNVSRKWAVGEFLQDYWLVLLLHLRERGISRAQTVDDLFYHDDQMVQDAVATFVKERSGRGVLLIFDGFDELSFAQRREQSLFLDIIKGKILNKCSVVITSRPYASRPVQELQSVDRHIEVLGFTNEQIHKCIKQRISDEAKAEELCAELEDRLDIASICQIPLSCSIVLYVYEMENYRLPNTLTELFELFVLHGLRRYATRTQDPDVAETLYDIDSLPMPIRDYFNVLSKIAYEGLKEDKLVFDRNELKLEFSPAFTGKDLPVLDLMTSAKSYSSRGTHDTYGFLHLTIQEYLGAFWAAKNLSDKDKLEFLRENLKKERFYMTLWFFAGITKLDISNVCSIFSNDLWEYDNHVHICHLLYESDSKNHSHCGYVAENCVSNRELSFSEGFTNPIYNQRHSRFDCLMISHFLAHSQCQWNRLTLHLDDVKILHKVFNGLNICGTSILQVIIEVNKSSIATFHEGIINMLDEIPQFCSVRISFVLDNLSIEKIFQAIKGNIKNVLMTKAMKSICVGVTGDNKDEVTRSLYEFIEGRAYYNSLVTVQTIEYLISLLIEWNSNLELVNLSIFKSSPHCHKEKHYHEFFRSLSTFLSKNSSLRQGTISPPFDDHYLVKCIDTILDQNLPLENLVGIIFQRNKHTSKLELIKRCNFLHYSLAEECSASHRPISVPQRTYNIMEMSSEIVVPRFRHSNMQTQCRMPSGNSESSCIDFFQTSPAKRQKVGNPSKESSCQATVVHVQSELNPHQPQPPMAALSSSQSPPLTSSPQLRPNYYCMAGSSPTQRTLHSVSHTGMNPPLAPYSAPASLPLAAGHTRQNFTSESEQYHPATAPPIQTIHNPNTGGASSATSADYLPSPLPTTSTST